jgi:hypothetical protein
LIANWYQAQPLAPSAQAPNFLVGHADPAQREPGVRSQRVRQGRPRDAGHGGVGHRDGIAVVALGLQPRLADEAVTQALQHHEFAVLSRALEGASPSPTKCM